MNPKDPSKQDELFNQPDPALDTLEAMWDRQIMKGDDEYDENNVSPISNPAKNDRNENVEPEKERKRRGHRL